VTNINSRSPRPKPKRGWGSLLATFALVLIGVIIYGNLPSSPHSDPAVMADLSGAQEEEAFATLIEKRGGSRETGKQGFREIELGQIARRLGASSGAVKCGLRSKEWKDGIDKVDIKRLQGIIERRGSSLSQAETAYYGSKFAAPESGPNTADGCQRLSQSGDLEGLDAYLAKQNR